MPGYVALSSQKGTIKIASLKSTKEWTKGYWQQQESHGRNEVPIIDLMNKGVKIAYIFARCYTVRVDTNGKSLANKLQLGQKT